MPSILLVDDETAIVRLLTMMFQKTGWEIRTANSVGDAMAECAVHGQFTAVLTDVNMPGGGDGFQLARWIHQEYPETCVFMMSADYGDGGKIPANVHLLPKPFNAREAVKAITRHCAQFPYLYIDR